MADKFHIDDIFKKSLKGMNQTPPAYNWDRIKMSLDSEIANKRRTLIWYAAASVFVIVSFISGFIISSGSVTQLSVVQPAQNEQSPATEVQQPRLTTPRQVSKPTAQQLASTANPKKNVHASIAVTKASVNPHLDNTDKITVKNKMLFAAIHSIDVQILKTSKVVSTGFAPMVMTVLQPQLYPEEDNDWSSRLSVGGNVSPVLAYRTGNANKAINNHNNLLSATTSDFSANIDNPEYPVFAYSGGASILYDVTSRFRFQTGFSYSKTGQLTDNAYLSESRRRSSGSISIVNSSFGPVVSDQNTESVMSEIVKRESTVLGMESDGSLLYKSNYSLIQNFSYLELPLVIRYTLIDRSVSLDITGGVLPSLLVGNKAYLEINNTRQNVGKTSGVNLFNTFATLGISTRYSITRNLSMVVEPYFKYALSEINNNPDYSARPYSVGIFTGAFYRF